MSEESRTVFKAVESAEQGVDAAARATKDGRAPA
jgi:hypothetical protein